MGRSAGASSRAGCPQVYKFSSLLELARSSDAFVFCILVTVLSAWSADQNSASGSIEPQVQERFCIACVTWP